MKMSNAVHMYQFTIISIKVTDFVFLILNYRNLSKFTMYFNFWEDRQSLYMLIYYID